MPKPKIQWFHNQQLMLPTKDLVFHFDESTGTAILIIVDAFLEHAGQYSCKARNSAGETTCTATLTVTAEVQALDRQSSGKDVKEPMRSQAISELHVAPLTKNNIKTCQKEFKSVEQPSQELGVQVFESVSESLTMKATSVEEMEAMHTTILSQTSQSIRISMATAQEMKDVPPKILLQLRDLTVKCGDTAQFICGLENEFFSEFLWAYEAKEAQAKAVTKITLESDTKSFKAAKDCQFKASEVKQEPSKKTSSLFVSTSQRPYETEKQRNRGYYPDVVPCEDITETHAEAPEFLETLPSEIIVKEGDDVLLFCIMKGVPTPCVVWLCNQLIVEESALCSLKHAGPLCSLSLLKVGQKHEGIYKCRIVNPAGQAECSTHLRVAGWQLHVPSKYQFLVHSIIAFQYIHFLGDDKE
ncbi:PREDICTED: twitchin-like [Chlamydotis macqueenii]|uniref:twitchin-like n=1 Tax=Chlamydotis macqueenii TaxID=187382 RepID=UPI00052964D4|nr:PREDICTED: twitchin-like [Chlamydotis macqueenii]